MNNNDEYIDINMSDSPLDIQKKVSSPLINVKFDLITRRNVCLQYIRIYETVKSVKKIAPSKSPELIGAVRSLYYDVSPSMKDEDIRLHNKTSELVFSNQPAEVIKGFEIINDYLYKKRLVQFDDKTYYDPTDVDKHNKAFGL